MCLYHNFLVSLSFSFSFAFLGITNYISESQNATATEDDSSYTNTTPHSCPKTVYTPQQKNQQEEPNPRTFLLFSSSPPVSSLEIQNATKTSTPPPVSYEEKQQIQDDQKTNQTALQETGKAKGGDSPTAVGLEGPRLLLTKRKLPEEDGREEDPGVKPPKAWPSDDETATAQSGKGCLPKALLSPSLGLLNETARNIKELRRCRRFIATTLNENRSIKTVVVLGSGTSSLNLFI